MPEIIDPKLKNELARLAKKANAIKERQRQIIFKASKQARAAQNQRKFIAGAIAMKALASDAAFREGFEMYFKREVLEADQYKFPEYWPTATKPERTPNKK